MPINLSIKNAPDDIVGRLRLRAQRNHRSLQGELLAIIEDAVRPAGRSAVDAVPPDDLAAARLDRERMIGQIVDLMGQGLPLDDRRFTRDEMHEP